MAKKEEIVADLKKLLETDTTRSKMGKIYEVYDEIVELQLAGVSIANIEASLNAKGFDLKPGNLTSYLYQIRKKKSANWVPGMPDRRGQKGPKTPRAPKPPNNPPATPDSMEGEEIDQQKPQDRKAAAIAKAEQYTNNSSTSYLDNIIGKGKTK